MTAGLDKINQIEIKPGKFNFQYYISFQTASKLTAIRIPIPLVERQTNVSSWVIADSNSTVRLCLLCYVFCCKTRNLRRSIFSPKADFAKNSNHSACVRYSGPHTAKNRFDGMVLDDIEFSVTMVKPWFIGLYPKGGVIPIGGSA